MSATEPRRDLKRLDGGALEDLTEPCKGCGNDVTRTVAPADTTFGKLQRATGAYCSSCIATMDAADAALDRERQEHDLAERRRIALSRAGLPPLFADATLDICRTDGVPEHAIAAAERWAAGSIHGLLLTGPVGVGKSTLSAAAVKARIAIDGKPAHWTTAPNLFAALAGGYENPARGRALEVIQDGRALALDDIDKGRPTPYGAEMTYLAVDQRIVNRAPLLVTANSSLDGLAGRWPEEYSEAIVSRLIGHCELIAIDGTDRRIPT